MFASPKSLTALVALLLSTSTHASMLEGATVRESGDYTTWVKPFVGYMHQDLIDDNPGYEGHYYGLAVGAHKGVAPGFDVGAALNYQRTRSQKLGEFRDNLRVDSTQLALYLLWTVEKNFKFEGRIAYALNGYENDRYFFAPSTQKVNAHSEYSGGQFSYALQGTYEYFFYDQWSLSPSFKVNFNHLCMENYHEEGAIGFNRAVAAQKDDQMLLGLGLELAYLNTYPNATIRTFVKAGGQRDANNDSIRVTHQELGSGTAYPIAFMPSRFHSSLQGGFLVRGSNHRNLLFVYNFDTSREYREQSLCIRFSYDWQ